MKIVRQIKGSIEKMNASIDHGLVHIGLKKPSVQISSFEKNLSSFIQEFLINYSAGITLEHALKMTIESSCTEDALVKSVRVYPSVIEALNQYALKVDRKEIWRFIRLVNQKETTGSETTLFALEKFHDELWQQKLIGAKKKSEQISIQLTFLLMLSLISVIITVIAPIVMMYL